MSLSCQKVVKHVTGIKAVNDACISIVGGCKAPKLLYSLGDYPIVLERISDICGHLPRFCVQSLQICSNNKGVGKDS